MKNKGKIVVFILGVTIVLFYNNCTMYGDDIVSDKSSNSIAGVSLTPGFDPGFNPAPTPTPTYTCGDGKVNKTRSTTVVASRYTQIPHPNTDELETHFQGVTTEGMPHIFTTMGRGDHFSNDDLFVASDMLHFYGMMYYLTGKQIYLDYGIKLTNYMFNNTDEEHHRRGEYNPSDLSTHQNNEPIWTGTFAVIQNRNVAHVGWRHNDHFFDANNFSSQYNAGPGQVMSTVEVLTDGQVTSGIMVFIDLVLKRNQASSGDKATLLGYIPKVKKIIDSWQPTWRENVVNEKSETLNIDITVAGSYYKINPNTTNEFWKTVAYNQSANLLSAAMLVNKHTNGGVSAYLGMATKFATYLSGPEVQYLKGSKDYPYWPYSTDMDGVSDLDHTTFDMEFLIIAWNNCYGGVKSENLTGALNTVRDFAFKGAGSFSNPLFSDFMNGNNGYLGPQKQLAIATNWSLLPNADIVSSAHGQSFNDQIAEQFEWHKKNRPGPLNSSKYLRSAAEFLLATEKQ